MKRLLLSCVVAVFALALGSAMAQEKTPPKQADEAAKVLSATGTVSAVTADTLTLKAKSGEMVFSIDAKTTVSGKGLGTKTAELRKDGKSTPLTEFVHVGDGVDVKYHATGGSNHAQSIRIVNPAVKK